MAQTINLPLGTSTFGSSVNNDILISSMNMTGVNTLKTLIGGVWKSWASTAPDAFQAFLDIKKGHGYVATTNVIKTLTLSGADLDVNSMNYTTGLHMISLPYDSRPIGKGYIPRLKLDTIQNIDSTSLVWKTWVSGTPDGLQGFTTTSKNQGYVVNITEVHGSLINVITPNKSEGVRFNTVGVTVNDGTVTNGITYTNPMGLGGLSFDPITFDVTIPPSIMFLSVEGIVAKIDFPTEYNNKTFFISYNGVSYIGKFAENYNYNAPIILTDTVDNVNLDLTYDKLTINAGTAIYKEMNIIVGTENYIVEFATEYAGKSFKVWKDGKIGTGLFKEGNVTVTLV